jgi:chromosome segregation ATPase
MADNPAGKLVEVTAVGGAGGAPLPQTPEDRRLLAETRGHQALGRMGDFWALVAMAGSIQDTRAVLTEILTAKQDLEASLAESRKLAEERAASDAALKDQLAVLSKTATDNDAKLVAEAGALAARNAALDLRTTAVQDREQAATVRDNALSAREAKLTSDTAVAQAQLAETRAELATMQTDLDQRKSDLDAQIASFERRFQAARAILAAVPDEAQDGSSAAAV